MGVQEISKEMPRFVLRCSVDSYEFVGIRMKTLVFFRFRREQL
jgi:hypothetical protein